MSGNSFPCCVLAGLNCCYVLVLWLNPQKILRGDEACPFPHWSMSAASSEVEATLGPFLVPHNARILSRKRCETIWRLTCVQVNIKKAANKEVLLTLRGPASKLEHALRLAQAELGVILQAKPQERGSNYLRKPDFIQQGQQPAASSSSAQVDLQQAETQPSESSQKKSGPLLGRDWTPPEEELHLWEQRWNGAKCHPPNRFVWHRKAPCEVSDAAATKHEEEACPSIKWLATLVEYTKADDDEDSQMLQPKPAATEGITTSEIFYARAD